MANEAEIGPMGEGDMATHAITLDDGVDVSLLEHSLAKTPWERMQANDDALRFADSLRLAMQKRNAKSQRTDTPID